MYRGTWSLGGGDARRISYAQMFSARPLTMSIQRIPRMPCSWSNQVSGLFRNRDGSLHPFSYRQGPTIYALFTQNDGRFNFRFVTTSHLLCLQDCKPSFKCSRVIWSRGRNRCLIFDNTAMILAIRVLATFSPSRLASGILDSLTNPPDSCFYPPFTSSHSS